MPRYIVERSFHAGFASPVNKDGASAVREIVGTNGEEAVTWVHSYVSADKLRTFCVYDAPGPDAIREVAHRNGLSVGEITEVLVLDPYFYH